MRSDFHDEKFPRAICEFRYKFNPVQLYYIAKRCYAEYHLHIDYGMMDENDRVNMIIIMAGRAVFLRGWLPHGWLPHRGKAQIACNYCFPTRTMF